MRSTSLAFTAYLLLVSNGSASDNVPGQEAIKDILTGAKGWTFLSEFTDGSTPTERANTVTWEFQREGSGIKGRTTHLAAGFNCEFEVAIRDGGFDFNSRARGCSQFDVTIMLPLYYDPKDGTYPFKNRPSSPQKMWLMPKR